MIIKNEYIVESLRNEVNKQDNEETTFQIRIYDSKSGGAAYKQLNAKQLKQIIKILDNDLLFLGGK